MPKADEKGKLKERELLTDGRVLVTEVVIVLLMTGPPPTPTLGFAGTCGNLRFLKDKATGFWVIGKGVFGRGIARGFETPVEVEEAYDLQCHPLRLLQ